MKSITEIRRENAIALKNTLVKKTNAAFAKKVDRPATMVSRYIGKNPSQAIGDDFARHIEKCFNKPKNWLDTLQIKMESFSNNSQFGEIISNKAKEDNTNIYNIEDTVKITTNFQRVPVVGMAKLGNDGYFDEQQYPVGSGDGYIDFPTNDPNAYSLKTVGDSMHPAIRHGWFVIVEPNAEYHNEDLVLVKLKDGRKMIKEIRRRDQEFYTLISINEDHERLTVHRDDIEDIHLVGGIIPKNRVKHP